MAAYRARIVRGSLCALTGLWLYGCAATPDSAGNDANPTETATAQPPDAPPAAGRTAAQPPGTGRTMALVEGKPVRMSDLEPLLLEMAGTQALAEIVLDRRLELEMTRRGLSLDAGAVEQERRLLLATLSPNADDAVRLLSELRTRQGLGRTRFDALLRRNAALRRLVRDEVQVTDAALRQAWEALHGERRQPRLIVTPTLAQAEHALRRVARGESFADIAVDMSTDVSASRGGLIEPISAGDPSFPPAVREALFSMQAGEVSRPIMVDGGFALLRLERLVPGTGRTIEEEREPLTEFSRRRQERLLMEQLARRLVDEASLTILDDSLHDAWRRSRGGE